MFLVETIILFKPSKYSKSTEPLTGFANVSPFDLNIQTLFQMTIDFVALYLLQIILAQSVAKQIDPLQIWTGL